MRRGAAEDPDPRAVLAEITDSGRQAAREATRRLNEAVFARPGLAPDQVERLIEALHDLRAGAGDF